MSKTPNYFRGKTIIITGARHTGSAQQQPADAFFPVACITRYCWLARPSIDTFPSFH
jgi:hypothetical protein